MRAVRVLGTVGAIGVSLNNRDVAPIGVEFIGENSRQAGADSVTHLGTVGHNVDHAIGMNADENAGMERGRVNRSRNSGSCGPNGLREDSRAQYERPGGEHSLKKTAAADILDDNPLHGGLFRGDHAVSFAASLMAERIRW